MESNAGQQPVTSASVQHTNVNAEASMRWAKSPTRPVVRNPPLQLVTRVCHLSGGSVSCIFGSLNTVCCRENHTKLLIVFLHGLSRGSRACDARRSQAWRGPAIEHRANKQGRATGFTRVARPQSRTPAITLCGITGREVKGEEGGG